MLLTVGVMLYWHVIGTSICPHTCYAFPDKTQGHAMIRTIEALNFSCFHFNANTFGASFWNLEILYGLDQVFKR